MQHSDFFLIFFLKAHRPHQMIYHHDPNSESVYTKIYIQYLCSEQAHREIQHCTIKLPKCSTTSRHVSHNRGQIYLEQTLFWTCHYKIKNIYIDIFAQSSYKIMSNNILLVSRLPQGKGRLVDGFVGEHFNPGEQKALN